MAKPKGGVRPGAGAPSHKPTDERRSEVLDWSGRGVTHDDIAEAIGINDETLRKHYARELRRGKALARIAVGGKLYELAMSGNIAALIFYAKTQMGWKETDKREHTIEHPTLSAMSDEELVHALEARLGKLQIEQAANDADELEPLALSQ